MLLLGIANLLIWVTIKFLLLMIKLSLLASHKRISKSFEQERNIPFLMVIMDPYFPCHRIEMILRIHLNSIYFKREISCISCRWYTVDNLNFALNCQMVPELLCYISCRNQLWQRSSENKIKLLAFFCPVSPTNRIILKCSFQRLIFSILTSNEEIGFHILI